MKMVRNILVVALVGLMAFGIVHGPFTMPASFGGAALAEPVVTQATNPSLTVNGTGTVYKQPDQAMVMLGVQENAETVVEAQEIVNEKISAVTQALVEAGVQREDISVGYLSIYSNYDYNNSPPTIVGYSAQHQLVIKVSDITGAGAIIDTALKAGANQLDGINFTLKDNTPAYRQALELAIEDAASKAEAAASAYGKKLGRLISMTENMSYGGSYESGLYAKAEAEDAAGGAPTEVVAGDLSIAASINATYELIDE